MSQIRWSVIPRWFLLLFGLVILSTALSRPAAADQNVQANVECTISDDNGSDDILYGFASLTASDDGTELDAFAYDYLIRYDSNIGQWAALLDATLYINSTSVDHDLDYYDGGFGGSVYVEWQTTIEPGQQIQFSVGFGVMNDVDYLYWTELGWSDLLMTVQG